MWTHVQLAWWWYLELRRDRDIICILRYEPNLVLGWILVELMSVQLSSLKKTFESTWVIVPLRKDRDSLLSLVSHKPLLSLSTTLPVELSSLSCTSLSPWQKVLSLLTPVGWGWTRLWWIVLESEELKYRLLYIATWHNRVCLQGMYCITISMTISHWCWLFAFEVLII